MLKLALLVAATLILTATHALPPPPPPPPPPAVPSARPIFHFLPPAHWINDPCAPFYDPTTKLYHLFYQYNPDGTVWANTMNWGHAVSRDMLHWTNLPIALAPDASYDRAGVFTGSAAYVGGDGNVTVLYTGVAAGLNLDVAESVDAAAPANPADPNLVAWTKDAANPLVPMNEVPAVLGKATAFRDPTEVVVPPAAGKVPYFAIGAGSGAGLGYALRYTVPEYPAMSGMAYADVLLAANSSTVDGAIWECPDPFELAGLSVLKVSSRAGGYGDHYYLGRSLAVGVPFGPTAHGIVDYGMVYASKSFTDPVTSSRVQLGWIREGDSPASAKARGWAGVHMIPRTLSLVDSAGGGVLLAAAPIAGVASLHAGAPIDLPIPYSVFNATHMLGASFAGTTLDITATFEVPAPANASSDVPTVFGLVVRAGGPEQTRVGVALASPPGGMAGVAFPNGVPAVPPAHAASPARCAAACAAVPYCSAWTFNATLCTVYGAAGVPAVGAGPAVVSAWADTVFVDRTGASLAADQDTGPTSGILFTPAASLARDGVSRTIDLRILLDNSVVEVFANAATACLSTRIYPTLASSTAVGVFGSGISPAAHPTLASLRLWHMSSVWA